MGMSQLDPSIGGLLCNLGYATGQFGKNRVGDRNPSLPTVNGFDEFFGNLYHLNAEEEPELPDYPKNPAYLAKFGPRGVLLTKATAVDDATVDPRFGKVGMQTIKDTGPLTKKRMETIDDETSAPNRCARCPKASKPWAIRAAPPGGATRCAPCWPSPRGPRCAACAATRPRWRRHQGRYRSPRWAETQPA